MDQFAKETITISLEEEMRTSYLDYAMSVIVGRALPDVRDGLKPVHRRVLYGMNEMNNVWNRPYVKCARVVGEVMGKYHPHGDQSIYDTLVRMAQDFSLRYMLVDGQGNFGSVDGDGAAAMRYTECRLDKIANEMLADIDKETVDFQPNYDAKELEPTVLPTRIPNLLINGSSGIAVGMATNIPPHNLYETIDASLYLLHNPECSIDELIERMPAPDFPTGGIIYGISGVREGYRTGKGRVVMRAKTHIETEKDGSETIVIDEIPYQVNKKVLLERIAKHVKEKTIEGISNIRDESDKTGMRVVIELKRSEKNASVVLNNLFKLTQLQDTFGMNMVALVGGQPKLLNLKQMLQCFISHRREVVTRRTIFELRKARERGHILEGLTVALANIDDFIKIIRESPTPPEAKQRIMERSWNSQVIRQMIERTSQEHTNHIDDFRPEGLPKMYGVQEDGLYRLSDEQATEILQMRLQRLTGLEQDKIVNEYGEVMANIADLLDILAKPHRVTEIIDTELKEVIAEYSTKSKDERRSQIEFNAIDMEDEDLIKSEDMVVTMSHGGYIKSQLLSEYRSQKRGGRGRRAATTKEDDWVENLFIANTHDYILLFTNKGRLYWLKVWELPRGSHNSRGIPIINKVTLQPDEKITMLLPLSGEDRKFPANRYVFMATSRGIVKKTPLSDFGNPRKAGIIAVVLDEGDYLIGAELTDGKHDVMLFSDAGKSVRFNEEEVRSMGRTARGVRGMRIEEDQNIVALLVAGEETQSVLTVTEKGYGKRTPITDYTRHGRGIQGMIAIQTSERNGKLVAAKLVNPTDELMLITSGGVLIRTRVSEIRESARATQGVSLISVQEGTFLTGVQTILESESDDNDLEESEEE